MYLNFKRLSDGFGIYMVPIKYIVNLYIVQRTEWKTKPLPIAEK